jgi:DNA-binding NarL/FixJ family response regulator
VVLLDLRLPDLPGYEVCRRLKMLPDSPAVLVLTSFADDQLVLESISAGADGYLLKDFQQTELALAITRVAAGGSILDPTVARKVIGVARNDDRGRVAAGATPHGGGLAGGHGNGQSNGSTRARTDRLSPQEQRILNLLAEGNTNKEIAFAMGLGEGTVRNYLTSVFTKLGVENRTEAVSLWLRRA